MYWNELNEDNIEYAKELYCDYLQENKDKYSNQLKSFEEFLEDDVIKCERCEKPTLWDYLKDGMCECCYDDLYIIPEEPDHYEEEKLKEEGWL